MKIMITTLIAIISLASCKDINDSDPNYIAVKLNARKGYLEYYFSDKNLTVYPGDTIMIQSGISESAANVEFIPVYCGDNPFLSLSKFEISSNTDMAYTMVSPPFPFNLIKGECNPTNALKINFTYKISKSSRYYDYIKFNDDMSTGFWIGLNINK